MRFILMTLFVAAVPLSACNSAVSVGGTGATSTAGTGGVGGSSTTSGSTGATGTGGIDFNANPPNSFPCGGSECPNGNLCLTKDVGPPPTPPPGPDPGPCQPFPEVCAGMATCDCLLQHCPCGDPTLPCYPQLANCQQDSEGNINFVCVYP
jgi:hypothetical protein